MAELHRHILTPPQNTVLDLAFRLKGTKDPAQIGALLGDFLRPHGYGQFIYARIPARSGNGETTGSHAKVVNAARDWDLRNGVTLPLPCHGTSLAGISLVGDARACQVDQDRRFLTNEDDLVAAMHVFHSAVGMGAIARAFYGLTRREVEVLKWQSDGLRTKDIAAKLKTTTHTVEKQAKSARKRLGAASSIQAVAKAVMLGVLT